VKPFGRVPRWQHFVTYRAVEPIAVGEAVSLVGPDYAVAPATAHPDAEQVGIAKQSVQPGEMVTVLVDQSDDDDTVPAPPWW
jgi:hypothetical protein